MKVEVKRVRPISKYLDLSLNEDTISNIKPEQLEEVVELKKREFFANIISELKYDKQYTVKKEQKNMFRLDGKYLSEEVYHDLYKQTRQILMYSDKIFERVYRFEIEIIEHPHRKDIKSELIPENEPFMEIDELIMIKRRLKEELKRQNELNGIEWKE